MLRDFAAGVGWAGCSHLDAKALAALQLLKHACIALLLELRVTGGQVDEVGAMRQNLVRQEAKVQAGCLEGQHSLICQRRPIPPACHAFAMHESHSMKRQSGRGRERP